MTNPALRIRLAIQRHRLDIHVAVARIEVDGSQCCHLTGERGGDRHRLEEWGGDKINVLTGVGKETHHGHGDKGAHGARVVVAREAARSRVKVFRDVEMSARGRFSRTRSIVILEDGEERRLIPNVRDAGVVKVVEAPDKLRGSAKVSDERGHVVRNETEVCMR